MKFNPEKDEYTLKSGKTFNANNGILGLGKNNEISEGYDSFYFYVDNFTREERKEIAQFMIEKWIKWAEQ